jgi:serine/threonine protein kinase
MNETRNRVRSIFLNAVENYPPERWAAYLDEVCGGDPDLRARVQALLEADQKADSLLDRPGPSEPGEPNPSGPTLGPPSEGPGTVIGPYKLLEVLGEGGMGIVYRAEQTQPVRRSVALKIIKPGMDTRQVIARFEAERQALALMDHPSIAKVLDAGTTEQGGPYFVMELVKGVPITTYCDTVHLTTRDRLELFVPVCQAIQHAHQKGIIHRDIKPSNVLITMVDGKPVPKVIDFGVAKAIAQRLTERTIFTQHGAIVGTFEYMSPEQAELSGLDIDTRSDIYALGVLLYELLAGSTPLEKEKLRQAAYSEILRLIREEEPPKPSTRLSDSGDRLASLAAQRRTEPARLAKQVRGDLDWIVMKAIDKDRTRRYETANGFARDIQRHLDGDPVDAGPPSAWYKLRKFARRHRAILAAVALVALALITGTAVSVWQAVVARRARADAISESNRARKAEGDALSQRDNARKAVDDMYTQVAEQWLSQQPQLEPLQRDFLLKALAYYEEFARARGNDHNSREKSAEAFHRVGDIRLKLGEHREAEFAHGRALEILEAVVAEFPAVPEYRRELADAHRCHGILLKTIGRQRESETAYRRAIELQESLAAKSPAVLQYRGDLARTHNSLGVLLVDQRRVGEGERTYRRAVELQEALAAELPSSFAMFRAPS